MRVGALYHYPLKSGRGIAAERLRLTALGVEHDRCWMVVDAKGRFLTQRRLPRMALIAAEPSDVGLRLSAPGMPTLLVQNGERTLPVRVWGFEGPARDAGDGAAAWLSEYLGMTCRLVGIGPEFQRPVETGSGRRIAFADGYPLLLISQAALDGLNERLAVPVDMRRFRPNIVIDGCPAHAEDGWQRIRMGALRFRLAAPCARCTIPEVDPDSGERGAELTPTLSRYRRFSDGEIYFGQNLIHESEGELRLGDEVEVL